MAEEVKLIFEKEKETKNTFRYAEKEREDGPILVGNIYLQKFVAKNLGEKIEVTFKKA